MRWIIAALLAGVASSAALAIEVDVYSGPTLGWHKTYSCNHGGCEFKGESGPTDNTLPKQQIEETIRHNPEAFDHRRFDHGDVYIQRRSLWRE